MEFDPSSRSWRDKFRDAFRGVRTGVRGQSSFTVHLLMTLVVVVAATFFRVKPLEWCLLLLCIGSVMSAELFNTAIECLAKAVDSTPNHHIGAALDIASGAVLVSSIAASVVGVVIFLPRLLDLLVALGSIG